MSPGSNRYALIFAGANSSTTFGSLSPELLRHKLGRWSEPTTPFGLQPAAVIRAGLGDKDTALTSLEKAYEEHAVDLGELKVDPVVDGLRTDPRFQHLLHRIGL